jgi:hypothetical protein
MFLAFAYFAENQKLAFKHTICYTRFLLALVLVSILVLALVLVQVPTVVLVQVQVLVLVLVQGTGTSTSTCGQRLNNSYYWQCTKAYRSTSLAQTWSKRGPSMAQI